MIRPARSNATEVHSLSKHPFAASAPLLEELREAALRSVDRADPTTLALIVGLVGLLPVHLEDTTNRDPTAVEVDLTVSQVAELFDRSPQTVRGWIREERLQAYQLNDREYRITRVAVEEFQQCARDGNREQPGPLTPADLSAWKRDRGKQARKQTS